MSTIVGLTICLAAVMGAAPSTQREAGVHGATGHPGQNPEPRQSLELASTAARYRPNWRFEFNNDVFFGSDNFFSAGWSLQKHGKRVDSWDQARGTPAFGRPLARHFLPIHAASRSFREIWSVGQAIATPEDIDVTQLLQNDIPYSAMLGVTNGWIAFDDRHFTGFQMLLGLVGPAAMGEQVVRS